MQPKKEMIGPYEKTYSDSKRQMLVSDLIPLVLERLNFEALHKARSISLDWYSTAELNIRQNPTPWIILFSSNNDVSCKLFDPHHNKTYLVRDLGFGFHKSQCLANSGSWFLMLDHRTNFHLLNMFTRERIRLPTLESIEGWQMRFDRVGKSDFVVTLRDEASRISSISTSKKVRIRSAVLWVDERSIDYFVVWYFDGFFAYYKRGDSNKTWKVLRHESCVDMVFKDRKLYVLGSRNITVFDFSVGDTPKECASFPLPDYYHQKYFNNLAVTLSGEVLIISSIGKSFYNFYKMDRKSSGWSEIESLGDEALLLDQGITVAAKDGVMENCIYFSNDQFRRYEGMGLPGDDNGICVYNIQTKNVVQEFPHLTDSSPLPFKDARWFFPTFGGKWLL